MNFELYVHAGAAIGAGINFVTLSSWNHAGILDYQYSDKNKLKYV